MIESPVLQEFVREREVAAVEKAERAFAIENILGILADRFQIGSEDIEPALTAIHDIKRLQTLVRRAATCPDLATFRGLIETT